MLSSLEMGCYHLLETKFGSLGRSLCGIFYLFVLTGLSLGEGKVVIIFAKVMLYKIFLTYHFRLALEELVPAWGYKF